MESLISELSKVDVIHTKFAFQKGPFSMVKRPVGRLNIVFLMGASYGKDPNLDPIADSAASFLHHRVVAMSGHVPSVLCYSFSLVEVPLCA